MTPRVRAARALYSLDDHPENAKRDAKPLWQDYLPEARAVLRSVREPSDLMLDAAHGNEHAYWMTGWHAMIDAALAD